MSSLENNVRGTSIKMPTKRVKNLDPSGRKERLFLTAVFVYHLVITSAAPLSRMFMNAWYATGPVLTRYGVKIDFMPAYPSLAPGSAGDRAFSWHAGLAVLWMICGYIQLVWTTRLLGRSRKLHSIFGYISLLVYLLHLAGALNIWATDHEEHSILNRAMLFNAAFGVAYLVFEGVKKPVLASLTRMTRMTSLSIHGSNNGKKRRNQSAMAAEDYFYHRYMMCQAYLFSLNGAGTIRTVAIIQSNLQYGSVLCQVTHGTIGGNCDWTYTFRMLFAHALTLLQRGVYIRLKRNEFDSQFLKEVMELAVFWIIMAGSMILGFGQFETLVFCVLFKVTWVVRDVIKQYGQVLRKVCKSAGDKLEWKASNVSMLLWSDIHKFAGLESDLEEVALATKEE